MRVLELFSGIGGMHYALAAAGIKVEEVIAVEINTVANEVYKYNIPSSTLLQKNILSLSSNELNKFAPEMILMSPPCQPFTRVGLKKDLDDVRTDPLKHIIGLLPHLHSVKYILVENVKGFESSEARSGLKCCLESLHFNIQELLISPTQIGIPNTRTRYYMLAKKSPMEFRYSVTSVSEKLPEEAKQVLEKLDENFPKIRTIADLLETDDVSSNEFKEHLIPDSVVEKRVWVMDVVTKDSHNSNCFTKAYGRYAEGTGSVYCPYSLERMNKVLQGQTCSTVDTVALRELYLRYFTPREVARLMSFPDKLKFPLTSTRKQKYRLLGNSINVKVVALLISLMLLERDR